VKLIALVAFLIAAVANVSGNAPADRYFGKLKMSALRIRYEVMQLRPRYETHKLLPEEAEHLALLDEDAYYSWAAQYPHDTWLPSTAYLLADFYEELPGSNARNHAVRMLSFIKVRFPNTTYAKKAAAALHRGIPVRPDPNWAVEMRAARASPTPNALTTPSGLPKPGAPQPSITPSAIPSPTATASPLRH
jgi:hypothetical protein